MDFKERSTQNKHAHKKLDTSNVKRIFFNDKPSTSTPYKQKKKPYKKKWCVSKLDHNTKTAVTPSSPKSFNKNVETANDSEKVKSTFQTPITNDAITSIEIFKDDSADTILLLESSDDDEVVEIALPPKPTFYVDSSDDEEVLTIAAKEASLATVQSKIESETTPDKNLQAIKKSTQKSNESNSTCSSPVPSVVSSVSDDFIRGDCVTLNITKRQEKTFNFDFNLHGTDLMDESRNNSLIESSKKRKQKQKINKNDKSVAVGDFAKPNNKSKTKKLSKNVIEDLPELDLFDSDSSSLLLENISDTPISVDENVESATTTSQSINVKINNVSVGERTIIISNSANNSGLNETEEIEQPSKDEPIKESVILPNVSGVSSPASLQSTSQLKTLDKDLGKDCTLRGNNSNPRCSSPVPCAFSSVLDDLNPGNCDTQYKSKRKENTFNLDFNLHDSGFMDESRKKSLIAGGKKKKQKINKNDASGDVNDFVNPKNKSKTKMHSTSVNKNVSELDEFECLSSNELLENISETPLAIDENVKSATSTSHCINSEPENTSVENNSGILISKAANMSSVTINITTENELNVAEPIIENPILNVSEVSSLASLQSTNQLKTTLEKNSDKECIQSVRESNPTCSSPVPLAVASVPDDLISEDLHSVMVDTDLMDESRNKSLILASKKKKQKTNKTDTSGAVGDFVNLKNKSKAKKHSTSVNKNLFNLDESISSTQLSENISDTPLAVDKNDKSATTASHPVNGKSGNACLENNSWVDVSESSNESLVTINITGEIEEPSIDEPILENFVIANVSGLSRFNSCSTIDLDDEVLETKKCVYQPVLLEPGYDFSDPHIMEKNILEMKTFYDESWGGEQFDHRKILKQMPRDKSLWTIVTADKSPKRTRRGFSICNYCNKFGHRSDRCPRKPKICYMCGSKGHAEPRCPNKICLNCGGPNFLFSGGCRQCASWARMSCKICHGRGHPPEACPDTWRRYHRTVNHDGELVQFRNVKKNGELSCSGCGRQGHLVHACNFFIKFSRLPVPTAYIQNYEPLYEAPKQKQINVNTSTPRANKISQSKKSKPAEPTKTVNTQKNNTNMMQVTVKNNLVPTKTLQQPNTVSKSTHHVTSYAATPIAKKRCLSDNVLSNASTAHYSQAPTFSPDECLLGTPKSKRNETFKTNSFSEAERLTTVALVSSLETPPAKLLGKKKLELLETPSGNKKRRVCEENVQAKLNKPAIVGTPLVQDNRVSNSDDVVKRYHINITQEEYNILNCIEGCEYLNMLKLQYKLEKFTLSCPHFGRPPFVIMFEGYDDRTLKEKISVDVSSWVQANRKQSSTKNITNVENEQQLSENQVVGSNSLLVCNLPRKRKLLVQLLKKDLDELQNDLGDPKAIHKELLFLEKHHAKLVKEKCQKTLQNNRRQKINKHIKALNMILLGQAGLADGAKRLNALYAITNKLQAGTGELVADNVRCDVAQHYKILFSSASRNDYPELVAKYYLHPNNKTFQNGKLTNEKSNIKKLIPIKKTYTRETNNVAKHPQLHQQHINLNQEIIRRVSFCTSRLQTIHVTSAQQNAFIGNYLFQLQDVMQHLHNHSLNNQQDVHKYANYVTGEVLEFLHSGY